MPIRNDMDLMVALRACPPEDQAGVIHAISPIFVKLGQIEGQIEGSYTIPLLFLHKLFEILHKIRVKVGGSCT